MSDVVLDYPRQWPSFEPGRLRAPTIWRIAREARNQICVDPERLRIDVAELIAGSRRLCVNGLSYETRWDCALPVTDDEGRPALGAMEYHDDCPDTALILVNAGLIGDRDDVLRSTALHELGHAVFDAPCWIAQPHPSTGDGTRSRMRLTLSARPRPAEPHGQREMDWREWRANEFMGAFLAPRPILHRHLLEQARRLGVPLVPAPSSFRLPALNGLRAGPDGIEAVAIELAELFGLSIPFVHVRMRKYGLVHGAVWER